MVYIEMLYFWLSSDLCRESDNCPTIVMDVLYVMCWCVTRDISCAVVSYVLCCIFSLFSTDLCRESDNCPTIGSTATRINTPVDKPTFKYSVGAASTAEREEPLPAAPPRSLTICTRQTESGRADRVMVDRCVCVGGRI